MKKGAPESGEQNLHRNRPEVVLCLGGVHRARAGPDDHKPCGGGSRPHRENHLPCRIPLAEILWHPGAGTAV